MKNERFNFYHEKRLIYEWEESLDSIIIFIPCPQLPSNIKKSSIFDVKISSLSLKVGIKGNPPYLFHEFKGIAQSQQSVWYIQANPQTKKDELVIQIQKAQKGIRWGCVFKQHQRLNPLQDEQLKKKLMLERFQQEHPGFDFSDASFNGQVPDARTFMGGVH